MKWDQKAGALQLNERDLAIMAQCGDRFGELASSKTTKKLLPPLWSVLSYEMLRCPTLAVPFFWETYRQTRMLAAESDSHYAPAYISKNTGGTRTLHVPDELLSMHQRFILREILNFIPVSEHACAYRKGVSLRDCAVPHANRPAVLHLDIRGFFSGITQTMVFSALQKETGYSAQLTDLLSKLCCHRGRLPQGACTSPALSNICFRPCDDALALYAQSSGLVYTRYSDDLFFSGTFEDAGKTIRELTEVLSRFGFKVNPAKTKVLRRNAAQKILGVVVNDHPQASREYRRALRQELHYLHKYGQKATAAQKVPSWQHYLNRLQGKIAYVLSLDPENEFFRKEKSRLHLLLSEANELEMELDEKIRDHLEQDDYDPYQIEELISHLPTARKSALALLQLTDSFDLSELYDALFDRFSVCLTTAELASLKEKAKEVWDPFVWEKWEL